MNDKTMVNLRVEAVIDRNFNIVLSVARSVISEEITISRDSGSGSNIFTVTTSSENAEHVRQFVNDNIFSEFIYVYIDD